MTSELTIPKIIERNLSNVDLGQILLVILGKEIGIE